jgi:hypothetical protein
MAVANSYSGIAYRLPRHLPGLAEVPCVVWLVLPCNGPGGLSKRLGMVHIPRTPRDTQFGPPF